VARKATTVHTALQAGSTTGFTCRGPKQWEVTRIYIAAATTADTYVDVHHLTGVETVADVASILLKNAKIPGSNGLDTELTSLYLSPGDTITFVTAGSDLAVSHVSARELGP